MEVLHTCLLFLLCEIKSFPRVSDVVTYFPQWYKLDLRTSDLRMFFIFYRFWFAVEHPGSNECTILLINIFFGGKSEWLVVFYEDVRKANWVQLSKCSSRYLDRENEALKISENSWKTE